MAESTDGGISGVQARLNNLGYGAGPCDGVLGQRTRAALRLFQEDQEIDVTGEPDRATLDELEQAYGC
jgi:peptidoglycan hydrolase-like protein with peptidoglycan-binding domain